MNADLFFERLWADYITMTPQAERIATALAERGEQPLNDHVAFRTFNQGPISLQQLEPSILSLGYTKFEDYDFKKKKLNATGYVPDDKRLPRIFLSELRVEELSKDAAQIIQRLIAQIPDEFSPTPALFWQGLLWDSPSFDEYQTLANESEYAAWLSVIGLRANHFTINVNSLTTFNEIEQMNQFVEAMGFSMNSSGGRIKGSPEVLLEQSSTIASQQEVEFANGECHTVPTCYYEFAKRYPDQTGQLYDGFVAASADKIFESTDASKPI